MIISVPKIRGLLAKHELDRETETDIALTMDKWVRKAHAVGYSEGFEEGQVERNER